MTKEEKNKIENALAASNPTQTISAVCREIVMDRIDRMHFADRELRFLVKDIIESADFGCEVEVEQIIIPETVSEEKNCMKRAIAWGAIGFASLIGAIVSEKVGIRGMFGLIATVSSFCAGHSLTNTVTVTPSTTKMRLVPISKVDDIAAIVDGFTKSLISLFDYRQIEGTHKDFLKWLQSQYANSTDETFKKDVIRLLGRFYYSLEDYSDSKIECFEVNEANVKEPITTIPALFTRDGRMLLKGHYVVPFKN